MQWWNQFIAWLSTDAGRVVIQNGVIPFVAIVVAGVIAAMIGRAASKRILAFQDRELKAAAVMALIGAGRKATLWSSLGGDEKQRVDNQLHEADIRVRLLPLNGTNAAADWAAHELGKMKKNSSSFSFQAEQSFVDYRDRLLEWQSKPKRARKLFAYDLEQWRYEDAADKNLVEKQQEWAATQVGSDTAVQTAAVESAEEAAPTSSPAPTTSVAAPETFATTPITPAPATPSVPVPPTAFPMPAATMAQPQVPTPFSSPTPVSSPAPVSSPRPVSFPSPATDENRSPKAEASHDEVHEGEVEDAEDNAATKPFGAATFSAPAYGAPKLDSETKSEDTTSDEAKSDERYVPPVTSWSIRKAAEPEQPDKPRSTF